MNLMHLERKSESWKQIYNADSPELIRHYEAQFIEGWQQCSDDFFKVLKESRITFFLSSFVILVAIPFVGQLLLPHIGQELNNRKMYWNPIFNKRTNIIT